MGASLFIPLWLIRERINGGERGGLSLTHPDLDAHGGEGGVGGRRALGRIFVARHQSTSQGSV